MHASQVHPHRERIRLPTLCSPSADYPVVSSSSPFSTFHLLRNYRLFGTSAGSAVAAAAAAAAASGLVTNPRYELLCPTHQSVITPVPCSYRDYDIISEDYKKDSSALTLSPKRLQLAEDSTSSSSPPAVPISTWTAIAPVNPAIAASAGLHRHQSTTHSSNPYPNLLLSAIRQPALSNVPQRLPDSASFSDPEITGGRRYFVNDPGVFSHCRLRRPRSEKRLIPDEQKDDKYYERRKRNNQAAKKSRDARKIREDHIALRATMLEHENGFLRTQILTLREEAQSLRQMLIDQQMTKISPRYVMDCPRRELSSPPLLSRDASKTIANTPALESSTSESVIFHHSSERTATSMFL